MRLLGLQGKHIAGLNLYEGSRELGYGGRGALTLSPSTPVMHSGKGVLCATAKSSNTWLGVVPKVLRHTSVHIPTYQVQRAKC